MLADAGRLVEAVKRAALDAVEAGKPVNVCFGLVLGTSPLQVRVEQKMTLGMGQLVLSRNVTDYETEVEVDWETGEEGQDHSHRQITAIGDGLDPAAGEVPGGGTGSQSARHTHRVTGRKKIRVCNRLKAGDQVVLVRVQEGQKFLVLDRTGG